MAVAQSTVTARIRVLEAEVGGPVFDRGRSKTELTEVGRAYIRYAERGLRALAEGREAVRQVRRAMDARGAVAVCRFRRRHGTSKDDRWSLTAAVVEISVGTSPGSLPICS